MRSRSAYLWLVLALVLGFVPGCAIVAAFFGMEEMQRESVDNSVGGSPSEGIQSQGAEAQREIDRTW